MAKYMVKENIAIVMELFARDNFTVASLGEHVKLRTLKEEIYNHTRAK
jgi:hypothetical protein